MAKSAGISERTSCTMLGISRGSLHKTAASQRAEKQDAVLAAIQSSFAAAKERYGSPRVHLDLKEAGYTTSKTTVERVMRDHGMKARTKRRYTPSTTDSNHGHRIAENKLNRQFEVEAPNSVWVGDLSYFRTGDGWAYLATVIDLFSRRIIGWTLRLSLHAEGAIDALKRAMEERSDVHGVMIHHDRGVQYACDDYAKLIAANQGILSMSRKGNCWDNAVAESFFATIKRELGAVFESFSEAAREIEKYIRWYNTERRHSHNRGISPIRAELAYQLSAAA